MTLSELYGLIGGDYEKATSVLRMEKLIDKHIRKFTSSGVVEAVIAAGESMDGEKIFEAAHAMKGVTANLGLTSLCEKASALCEEFRPGNEKKLSDEEVKKLIRETEELYRRTAESIDAYAASQG